MTSRNRDRDSDYFYDMHEQERGWGPDLYECPICHSWYEKEDTVENEFLDDIICIPCDTEWTATHCVQCGTEMEADENGLKEGDICSICAEGVRLLLLGIVPKIEPIKPRWDHEMWSVKWEYPKPKEETLRRRQHEHPPNGYRGNGRAVPDSDVPREPRVRNPHQPRRSHDLARQESQQALCATGGIPQAEGRAPAGRHLRQQRGRVEEKRH